jgi:hypothetical protein
MKSENVGLACSLLLLSSGTAFQVAQYEVAAMKLVRTLSILVMGTLAIAEAASATTITYSATNGSNLTASATFEIVGGDLQITLSNTSSSDVLNSAQLLTALFFDLDPTVGLTPISALLASGSTVVNGPTGGGNVGGEFAYDDGLAGAPAGAGLGVSNSGLGLFGDANFNGTNLSGPTAVDGPQYGITSAGDNTATGNTALLTTPIIQSSVIFLLDIGGSTVYSDISEFSISNVSFQYGTALGDTNLKVPDGGSTAALLGVALFGFEFARRKFSGR